MYASFKKTVAGSYTCWFVFPVRSQWLCLVLRTPALSFSLVLIVLIQVLLCDSGWLEIYNATQAGLRLGVIVLLQPFKH